MTTVREGATESEGGASVQDFASRHLPSAMDHYVLRLARQVLRRREVGAGLALLILCGVFAADSPYFLTINEFSNVSLLASEYGIIAVGVCLLMVAGEFDLTVGAVFATTPWIMGSLFVTRHWPLWLAMIVGLLAAVGMGLINGVLTVGLRLPSFIVTLGMLFFWQGLLIGVTGGYPVSLPGTTPKLLRVMGGSLFGGRLYAPVIWYLGILVVTTYIAEFTTWGNWIHATGSNPVASKAMGVPVGRVKLVSFVVSAFLAGFTGILIFGYQGSAAAAQGQDFELYAIVAVVVGGTSLLGGEGTIAGSLIGALIIATASSGLVLIGAPPAWYTAFTGFILIASVIVNLRIGAAKLRSRFLG